MYDNGMAEGFDVGGKHKHDKTCKCANCLSIHNAKVHIGDTTKIDDGITQRGELVCTDLAGPFPADVHGCRYVISFTDFYSRSGSCYFLTKKSDAESALKLICCSAKKIRSDNFGQDGSAEYVFDRACTANNIIQELTPHDRPELKRPRVDQLKVFGCDCYKLLPKFPKVPGQQARESLFT